MNSIKRNSIHGVLGFAIPTVVMLVAYPVLVHHLGAAAFGIYILATSISGALAFLDFGFSAATLKFVAEDMANGDRKSAADVIVSSLLFYGSLGALGAIVIWVLSPWLVTLFSVDPTLQPDAVWVFRLAAIQFAAFLLMTVFVSLFKGLQRFDLSTSGLSLLSLLTYGGAIAGVLLAGIGLLGVTAISVMANLAILTFSIFMGLSLCRASGISLRTAHPSFSTFRRLFGFGAVMAVNSLAGLLLYRVQQYIVAAFIGPAAVTVYVLAFTVALKGHALVGAATEVMFPLASALRDRTRLRHVYMRMLVGSGGIALICLLGFGLLSREILSYWVGSELAYQSAGLLPIFALGCFFLALSAAPYHVVNGIGRPGFNTLFYAINAIANVALIALFALNGITLSELAWSFALANIFTSLVYQTAVEVLVWRQGLLVSS